VWTRDPDFGYEVVDLEAPENADLVEKVPAAVLQPRTWFEAQGRMGDYQTWVTTMKEQRRAFLEKYGVDEEIVSAVVA
jgi:hypothetical protein